MRLAAALFLVLAVTGCNRLRAVQGEQINEAVAAANADVPITGEPAEGVVYDPETDGLRFPGEVHLRNVRQLTFGGNNAEAYWSPDGTELIFQSDWSAINDQGCDQQFIMSAAAGAGVEGDGAELVSTGQGRTTCGYFLSDDRIVYASTHAEDRACPVTAAARTGRYVWDVFSSFAIYAADADGSNPQAIIESEFYDAEATVSPDGRYIVFTSTRSGDLELWRYEVETGDLLQLTDELGYDGGAFFSPDGSQIVWRASRPTGAEAETYRELLTQDAVQPGALDLYVANADGTDQRRVTRLPGANWAPFFHPSGDKILFASNHHTMSTGGREFDLFLVDLDGGDLERVTFSGTFDAFPMFSPDGTRLVFASNRQSDGVPTRDTNVFVADWVEEPGDADREFGM